MYTDTSPKKEKNVKKIMNGYFLQTFKFYAYESWIFLAFDALIIFYLMVKLIKKKRKERK